MAEMVLRRLDAHPERSDANQFDLSGSSVDGLSQAVYLEIPQGRRNQGI
jgi:hypothetical protein